MAKRRGRTDVLLQFSSQNRLLQLKGHADRIPQYPGSEGKLYVEDPRLCAHSTVDERLHQQSKPSRYFLHLIVSGRIGLLRASLHRTNASHLGPRDYLAGRHILCLPGLGRNRGTRVERVLPASPSPHEYGLSTLALDGVS